MLSGSQGRLLVVVPMLVLLVGSASAFGAGEVPAGSDFKGFVWRHGDIVDVLQFLPVSFVTNHRFTRLQRKQIYFGNWLRDFSQVIDTTLLENVPEPILRAIISIFGFLEFGFATDEFEINRDRLGCYSHVEHIDNPRGYPDNAQEVDSRLRGPVLATELEFDPKTGMKNYIANSNQGWPTAADYIRDQLRLCIELGRQKSDHQARKECFIHLGAALHTLEDFPAHSNFIELCLRELGEEDVFPFVGDMCRIRVPRRLIRRKEVPPLITGTFGMLDIFHSLLGEADDLAILRSMGTLGELEKKLGYGSMAFEQLFELLKSAIEMISSANDNNPLLQELEAVGVIFKQAKEKSASSDSGDASGIKNPNFLWQAIEPIFFLHDRLSKWIQESAQESEEVHPGESDSQLEDYTNQLVFRFLAVMIESAIKELRNAVKAAKEKVDEEAAKAESAAVYEDHSSASDPSHSDLSKDHFSNILNQPAGLIATVTTNWTTQQIVKCWDDPSLDAGKIIDEVLTILHHPAFPKKRTPIQQYMFEAVQKWWTDTPAEGKSKLRIQLTKSSVQARGHEDHELAVKELVGKQRGPGDFPGARPQVVSPPKRASFPLAWALNEAFNDIRWVFGIVRKSTSDPIGALTDVVYGTKNLVVAVIRAIPRSLRWAASKLRPW